MPRPDTGLATLQAAYAVPTNNLLVFRARCAGTLVRFAVYAQTGPAGGAATFDIKKNGVTALGAPLSLGSGLNSATTGALAVAVVEGDLISVDLLSTPSSIGSDLTVYCEIEETGASASDAQLRDRSTHTGTQLASTISDFAAAVGLLGVGSTGTDTAPADLYINDSTGNDTTGDGTISLPYKTLAKALSRLPYVLMTSHTINVADGTYAEAINLTKYACVNNALLKIAGNTTTPANVSFTGTVNQTVRTATLTAVAAVAGNVNVELEGIRVNATADFGIFVNSRANCIIDRCVTAGTLGRGVAAWNFGNINFKGNCTIAGWSSAGVQFLDHSTGVMTGAGTLTCTGPGTAGIGIHILQNSSFVNFGSEPSGCNITITGVKYGFNVAFSSSFSWQSSSATITVDNGSTPANSAGVLATDNSSWSTTQTITFDNLTAIFELNSICYAEATGTRNLTATGAAITLQNSVAYLP